MRYLLTFTAVLSAVLCQAAPGQSAPGSTQTAPAKVAPTIEAPAIPARASAAEYQAHAASGAYTVAAEFTGHSIATPLATFTDEDYVTVEVAFFGPAGSRLRLSHQDFSLRINGKKALPSQIYLSMYKSLKDPSYVSPDEAAKAKEKADDAGVPVAGHSDDRNPIWHPVPFEVEHKMEVRVEKASLREGDRTLPEAGLVFFQYGGRENGITSVELLYDGPAGRVILPLHP